MDPVRNYLALIKSFLYTYGYTGIVAEEILGPVTIKAMENHGEEWDNPRWFWTAISGVLNNERYHRKHGRESKISILPTAYLYQSMPGEDGYSEYHEVIPSHLPEPEEAFFHNEDLETLLNLVDIDSRVALRLHEELGYTHEELSSFTGLSEHKIRLRLRSTEVSRTGAQTVCVSCRKPKEVNEEFLCKDCRVEEEFTTLPTRRKASRESVFSKRPWLNKR